MKISKLCIANKCEIYYINSENFEHATKLGFSEYKVGRDMFDTL